MNTNPRAKACPPTDIGMGGCPPGLTKISYKWPPIASKWGGAEQPHAAPASLRPCHAACNAAVTDAIQITFSRHRSSERLGADSRGPPTTRSGGLKQQDPMRPARSAIFRCCAASIEVADGSPGGSAYGVPGPISAAALSFRVPSRRPSR